KTNGSNTWLVACPWMTRAVAHAGTDEMACHQLYTSRSGSGPWEGTRSGTDMTLPDQLTWQAVTWSALHDVGTGPARDLSRSRGTPPLLQSQFGSICGVVFTHCAESLESGCDRCCPHLGRDRRVRNELCSGVCLPSDRPAAPGVVGTVGGNHRFGLVHHHRQCRAHPLGGHVGCDPESVPAWPVPQRPARPIS